MYQLIPLHSCDYLQKSSIKIKVATDEGKLPKWNVEQTLKLEGQYKVGSECELNSWPVRPTFYSYFKESVSGEYHIYIHKDQMNNDCIQRYDLFHWKPF